MDVAVKLHGKSQFELKIALSKNQLQVFQDALRYSAWQFDEGGSDPQSSVDLLYKLHDLIQKQTKVKGR